MSTKPMTEDEKLKFVETFGKATSDAKVGGVKVARVLACECCDQCPYITSAPGVKDIGWTCLVKRGGMDVTQAVQMGVVSPLCPIRRICVRIRQASPAQLDNLLNELGE